MKPACLCAVFHLILCRSRTPADTAYVRVFISDVNDNKPVFAQRLYEVGVDEDADVGLAVLTVSATDEDEGTLHGAADSGVRRRFWRRCKGNKVLKRLANQNQYKSSCEML